MSKRVLVCLLLSVFISVFIIGTNVYALSPEQKQKLMEDYKADLKQRSGSQISDEKLDSMAQEYIDWIEDAINNSSYTTSEEQTVDRDKDKYITYVNSVDEFFEEVCYQLKEHRNVEYYDTDVETLYNNADFIFDGIEKYYYENNPMMSSSYLIGFCDNSSTNCSWKERDIPGEKKYRIGITFKYKYTQEEIEEHTKNMIELSQSLKCDSDLESIISVHDYLAENFDWKDNINDALAGFKKGGATCDGYSMAVFALLTNMGINTRIVDGDVTNDRGEFHNTWNIVCLDGKWYNLDVSWDDNGAYGIEYDYFLKNNADFESHSYRDDSSDIKNMIAKESYPVPEELLKSNDQMSEEDLTPQVDNITNEKPKMTPKELVRRFWYLAIYIIVCIVALIRHMNKHNDESYERHTDDLSAEIASYYKSKGRSYYNDNNYEKKVLSQIGIFYVVLVVVMMIIGTLLISYINR